MISSPYCKCNRSVRKSIFDAIKDYAGTVINIPFDLSVEKVISQKPGQKHAYPVISLVPNISQESLEKIRNFLNIDSIKYGLLTEDRIDSLSKQLVAYKEN